MAGSPRKRARRILEGKPVAPDSRAPARAPAIARARERSVALDPIDDPMGAKAALVRCYFDVALKGDDTPAAKLVLEAIESKKEMQFFQMFQTREQAASWLLDNYELLLQMAGKRALNSASIQSDEGDGAEAGGPKPPEPGDGMR